MCTTLPGQLPLPRGLVLLTTVPWGSDYRVPWDRQSIFQGEKLAGSEGSESVQIETSC